ncbi:MAG: glycerophosphodiester phosphodiesterase [Promethearchaeota archaeon]
MNRSNPVNTLKKKHSIYVIAHKGANAECPGNTILSFETAAEIGADLIEFDIHKTVDDEIVIIHDSSTKRVSNLELNVEECTLEELKAVDLGQNQKIPLIDDLFKNEKLNGKIGFQVEIKQAGITSLLLEKIQKYNLESSILISSFIHEELSEFKKLNTSIPLVTLEPSGKGWVTGFFSKKRFIRDALDRNVYGIHPFYKMVNKSLIIQAHSNGLVVNPWTVDNPSDWKKLIELGVDGIITNDARGLIKYLETDSGI